MIIQGSDINLTALRGVKSLADLKKLRIFSHLPDEDQANEILWKTIQSLNRIDFPKPGTKKTLEDLPDDGND